MQVILLNDFNTGTNVIHNQKPFIETGLSNHDSQSKAKAKLFIETGLSGHGSQSKAQAKPLKTKCFEKIVNGF